VVVNTSLVRPTLRLETSSGVIHFRTPFDTYTDEMDYDQKVLEKAAEAIEKAREIHKIVVASPN